MSPICWQKLSKNFGEISNKLFVGNDWFSPIKASLLLREINFIANIKVNVRLFSLILILTRILIELFTRPHRFWAIFLRYWLQLLLDNCQGIIKIISLDLGYYFVMLASVLTNVWQISSSIVQQILNAFTHSRVFVLSFLWKLF